MSSISCGVGVVGWSGSCFSSFPRRRPFLYSRITVSVALALCSCPSWPCEKQVIAWSGISPCCGRPFAVALSPAWASTVRARPPYHSPPSHAAHGGYRLLAVQAVAGAVVHVAEVLGHHLKAFVAAGHLVRVVRVDGGLGLLSAYRTVVWPVADYAFSKRIQGLRLVSVIEPILVQRCVSEVAARVPEESSASWSSLAHAHLLVLLMSEGPGPFSATTDYTASRRTPVHAPVGRASPALGYPMGQFGMTSKVEVVTHIYLLLLR